MAKKNKKDGSMYLVLEGKIFVIEEDNKGAIISKDEIDGKDVLSIIANILTESALNELSVKETKTKKTTKKVGKKNVSKQR